MSSVIENVLMLCRITVTHASCVLILFVVNVRCGEVLFITRHCFPLSTKLNLLIFVLFWWVLRGTYPLSMSILNYVNRQTVLGTTSGDLEVNIHAFTNLGSRIHAW